MSEILTFEWLDTFATRDMHVTIAVFASRQLRQLCSFAVQRLFGSLSDAMDAGLQYGCLMVLVPVLMMMVILGCATGILATL